MLHNVNKKRLQQAIDAYNEMESYRANHNINEECHHLWNIFYNRACYCIDGMYNNNIPSLIYQTEAKYRTVERIYYAILILGLNESSLDYYEDYEVRGEEYYE